MDRRRFLQLALAYPFVMHRRPGSAPVESGRAPAGFAALPPNRLGIGEFRHLRTGLPFVLVPAGEFIMGSPPAESAEYGPIEPIRPVRIDTPFLMAKRVLTNSQYRRFRPAHVSGVSLFDEDPDRRAEFDGDDQPATGLSWDDAVAWCRWAGLRLPTEAEWEYAARGGDQRVFPWGNDGPAGWPGERTATSPVSSWPEGPFGLSGFGDVWEFCADRYSAPWVTGECEERVVKGGSWEGSLEFRFHRCAERSCVPTGEIGHHYGLRAVADWAGWA